MPKLDKYNFRDYVESDFNINFKNKKMSVLFFIKNKKFRFLYLYRLSAKLHRLNNKGFIFKVVRKLVAMYYGSLQHDFCCEIPQSTNVGKGLNLPHPYGIIINHSTIIGDNCTILQFVTFGNNSNKGNNNLPVIGNDVVIGAGAKIIGPCNIGNNVKIGANAVVVSDISSSCIAAGVPAKVIR